MQLLKRFSILMALSVAIFGCDDDAASGSPMGGADGSDLRPINPNMSTGNGTQMPNAMPMPTPTPSTPMGGTSGDEMNPPQSGGTPNQMGPTPVPTPMPPNGNGNTGAGGVRPCANAPSANGSTYGWGSAMQRPRWLSKHVP